MITSSSASADKPPTDLSPKSLILTAAIHSTSMKRCPQLGRSTSMVAEQIAPTCAKPSPSIPTASPVMNRVSPTSGNFVSMGLMIGSASRLSKRTETILTAMVTTRKATFISSFNAVILTPYSSTPLPVSKRKQATKVISIPPWLLWPGLIFPLRHKDVSGSSTTSISPRSSIISLRVPSFKMPTTFVKISICISILAVTNVGAFYPGTRTIPSASAVMAEPFSLILSSVMKSTRSRTLTNGISFTMSFLKNQSPNASTCAACAP